MVQLEILLCAEVVLSLLNLAAFIGLGLVHYTACEVRNLVSCLVVVNATHPHCQISLHLYQLLYVVIRLNYNHVHAAK